MRNWLWVVVSLIVVLIVVVVFSVLFFAPSSTQAAEVTTSSPVTWECAKFTDILGIGENLTASLNLDEGSVKEIVTLSSYDGGSVWFGLNITANLEEGYFRNLNTTFQGDCLTSTVEFANLGNASGNIHTADWKNLTARTYDDFLRGSTLKAYISLDGANNPKEVSSFIWLSWAVASPQNQTERLALDVEMTYFNGTDLKKVIQPFEITLQPNDNKSFETAREIQGNQTIRGAIGYYDHQDFFKVQVRSGTTLKATVDNAHGLLARENLSLYGLDDLNQTLSTDLSYDHDYPLSVQYTTDSTGYLYITIGWWAGSDIYLLTVTTYT